MKIQLSKHFEKVDSPFKIYMDKLKKQQKQTSKRRSTPKLNLRQQIEVIDPLNEELSQYKNTFEKMKVVPKSKAYCKMKKLMVEQERKLKHVRLEEIKRGSATVRTQLPELTTFSSHEFLTSIPDVDDFFKNQMRDTMLHENSLLNKTIEDRVHSINDTLKFLRGHGSLDSKTLSTYQHSIDIDSSIQMHRQRNRSLISSLKKQKKEIKQNRRHRRETELIHSLSQSKPIQKTKIKLKGLKSVEIKRLGEIKNVSPSIALLFEMSNLSELKQKKQSELDSLLKNEHENRDRNIDDKTSFYSDTIKLKSLNPSTQFKMRKIMNDKLLHRLKASKDQALNFGEFLVHLKETRTIICSELQEVFEALRVAMIGGKLLREEDYECILERFRGCEALKMPANLSILKRVRNMMV